MTPPKGWVHGMFDLSEGPVVGYQAALRGMHPDGDTYRAAVIKARTVRHGLMVRR